MALKDASLSLLPKTVVRKMYSGTKVNARKTNEVYVVTGKRKLDVTTNVGLVRMPPFMQRDKFVFLEILLGNAKNNYSYTTPDKRRDVVYWLAESWDKLESEKRVKSWKKILENAVTSKRGSETDVTEWTKNDEYSELTEGSIVEILNEPTAEREAEDL
ncbi:hypothetical protein FQA39_LY00596 [Lamprigera yunnana]|nr:hypothetical protein FQA39_LY00596 [Lamprigera yunnana]